MTIEMTRRIEYDPDVLAKHAMAGVDQGFASNARAGDFVIAGKNFGHGPLHVQGPLGLKGLGVAVLAESTARSFFRLAVAVGLPILPFAQGIHSFVVDGDEIEVDFSGGGIDNITGGKFKRFDGLPKQILAIISAGGERRWLEMKRADMPDQ